MLLFMLLVSRWAHLLVNFPHRAITSGLYLRAWPFWPRRYSYIGCECGRVWLDRVTDGDERALIRQWTRAR